MHTLLINSGKYSSNGNKAAMEKMPEVKMLFTGTPVSDGQINYIVNNGIDKIFNTIKDEIGETDGYHIEGEMINQIMQTFPKLKDAWREVSDDQKWIFVECMHYGIRPLIDKHLGYKQEK